MKGQACQVPLLSMCSSPFVSCLISLRRERLPRPSPLLPHHSLLPSALPFSLHRICTTWEARDKRQKKKKKPSKPSHRLPLEEMEAGITQGKRVTESRHSEPHFLTGWGKGRTQNDSPSCFPSCSLLSLLSPALLQANPGTRGSWRAAGPPDGAPREMGTPGHRTTHHCQRLSRSILTLSLDAASTPSPASRSHTPAGLCWDGLAQP